MVMLLRLALNSLMLYIVVTFASEETDTQKPPLTTTTTDTEMSLVPTAVVFEDNNLMEEAAYNCSEATRISNLSVTPSENQIFLMWNANDDANCDTYYDIFAIESSGRIPFPYFRHENRTFHTISNLDSCTTYYVSITPSYYLDNGSFAEEFEVTTLPREVKNMKITYQNEKTIIEWDPPNNNRCISEYIVSWYEGSVKTINTILFLDAMLSCVTVKVEASTEEGLLGKPTLLSTPGNIQNLEVYRLPGTASVNLTWSPPENSMCVATYLVYLNEEFFDSTNETMYLFEDLTLCTHYTFAVAARSFEGIDGASSNVTKELEPEVIGAIENLNVTYDDGNNSYILSWNPPSATVYCDISYLIQGSYYFNTTIYETWYVFSLEYSIPCSINNISITPTFHQIIGIPETILLQTPSAVRKPPDLLSYTSGSTWVYFNWSITDTSENYCKIEGINVTCFADDVVSVIQNVTTDNDFILVNLTDLKPYTSYVCWAALINEAGISDSSEVVEILTEEGVPSAPTSLNTEWVSGYSFSLVWEEPEDIPGRLQNYRISIISLGPVHYIPSVCDIKRYYSYTTEVNSTTRTFLFTLADPSFNYSVEVEASTGAGFGKVAELNVITDETPSQPVRDLSYVTDLYETEEYTANVNVSFLYPCNTNGILRGFTIVLSGSRQGFSDETVTISVASPGRFVFTLSAAYEYTLKVYAVNQKWDGIAEVKHFLAPDGVPPSASELLEEPVQTSSTEAEFTFSNTTFSNINGDIIYYAVMLSDSKFNRSSVYGFWNRSEESSWPFIGYWNDEADEILPYQATPSYWNPFKESNTTEYTFLIGSEQCEPNTTCNGPLRSGTCYSLILRGFTRHGFRDSYPRLFFLDVDLADNGDSLNIAIILSITLGSVAIISLAAFIYILWRKRHQWSRKQKKEAALKPNELSNVQVAPVPVPIGKFSRYYKDLKENDQKLKQQYTLINTKSAEEMLPYYTALLPKNRRKNRYTNILPFDETRVKLLDEKNPQDDYINASYIKGYSGNVEYIATQGPLAYTCADFWKMVIQENVKVIAMVAQFVEMNQPKCHKYFPNKHENMDIGDGIEVRCATELNFGIYCLRTLHIQKDLKQWSIVHLQFLNWPDHGCPTNTDVMIHFCQVMRQHVNADMGPIVVHCSAGVGRTGTLIAVDMLLQAIKDKKDIDIFGTVLNLRKQRAKMVQTEKQYAYIHDCVYDVIENPNLLNWEETSSEPIYENVDDLKANHSKESIL